MPTTHKPHEDLNTHEIAAHLKEIATTLAKIEERLAALEQSPLHGSARVISDSAKAFTEGARDMYERVEARKWFDKSYEAASKVCDTVGEQFKNWWETRNAKSSEESDKPVEGEVIRKREGKE